jgi:two-component system response regulator MtrA
VPAPRAVTGSRPARPPSVEPVETTARGSLVSTSSTDGTRSTTDDRRPTTGATAAFVGLRCVSHVKIGDVTQVEDSRARVLVVDDDASLSEMLSIVLRQEGFDSQVVDRGDEAMDAFRAYRPDVVLLDLMLPGKGGIDVCKEIRGESGVPIVMLTAKGDTIDVVVGLESGADDYVVKPFKPKELVARIRARVRRNEVPGSDTLTIGPLVIDVAGHAVTRDGQPVSLTPLEFDLLVCLARKPWQVFTREVLLEQVWGYRHAADTRLVNVHVQRLRSKVESDPENPEIVLTVRGVGYKAGTTGQQ